MRILLVGLNYWPEKVGIGRYSGELAAWLAAAGHEVRAIAAPPYYPDWRIDPGWRRPWWRRVWWRRERHGGVRVLRCPLYVPRRPSGLTRALHLLSFAATAFWPGLWTALTFRPQLVIAVAPALAAAPGALLAARLARAPAWLHLQDFELEAAFGLGLMKGGRLKRLALALEGRLLRRFRRISSISPAMCRRLAEKGVRRERIVLFPNWVDARAIRPLAGENRLRQELGLAAATRIALYSGNMGEKQGLEILVEAARRLAGRPDLLFLLVGEGAARARLEALADGLPNVRFLPLVEATRLNELLNLATLHLLPQRAGAADLVLPSKLTGMLASGRPVVATAAAGSGLADAVAGAGLRVEPGDAAGFAAAVAHLLDEPGLAGDLGEAARRRALAEWDAPAILRRFERELAALAATASLR